MGVKDLWHIISSLGERKSVYELQGKVVAIDLSGWVVDSQTVTDNIVQPKMYLRNLYFRTMFLLMQGISPVFVLEGEAPTLKHNTIAKRNDVRNGFQERKTKKKGGRTRFNRVLSECQKMLKYMGLACVQGTGEAEAMCAYLNQDGLVDGCISQDSDCFLYGAKVVYRNFTMGGTSKTNTSGAFIEEYSIEKIQEVLHIGRNKMITLALLCGCDYDSGINGIGKEAALKFFKLVEDDCVLERVKSWKTSKSLERLETELTNPNVCNNCGHAGNVKKHTKFGCTDCGTFTRCHDTYKEKRALMMNEIGLRKKALECETFPNQELINEFLIRKDATLPKVELRWKQPQIKKLVDFMNDYLAWEPHYAFEKVLPLATRWQLLHLPDMSPDKRLSISNLFVAEKIKKIRNIKCIASYEIIWKDESGLVERIREYEVSDAENDKDILQELTTIEPQEAVEKCYPELVEEFENARSSKSKKRTAKSRQKKANENSNENSDATKKTRRKARLSKANKKIDEFINKNQIASLEDSFEQMSITPKRSKMTYTSENASEPKLDKEKIDESINKNQIVSLEDSFKEMNITPNRSRMTYACGNASTPKLDQENEAPLFQSEHVKRGPQIKRVLNMELPRKPNLNNTLSRLINELSPDDFLTDNEDNDLDMSLAVARVCNTELFQFNTKALACDDGHTSHNNISNGTSNNLVILKENISERHSPIPVVINESACSEHNISIDYERRESPKLSKKNYEYTSSNKADNVECTIQQFASNSTRDSRRPETPDEFDILAENYVPLTQRLQLR